MEDVFFEYSFNDVKNIYIIWIKLEGVEKVDSFEVKYFILFDWVIKEVFCCKFEIYLVGGNIKFIVW